MNILRDDDRLPYAREKTRRIVGRVALRRASRIVQTWRAEEREDMRIAKRLCAGLFAAVLIGAALFIFN
jgi:hypothetical protein